MFNIHFAAATVIIQTRLLLAGLSVILPFVPDAAPWMPAESALPALRLPVPVSNAEYVDDGVWFLEHQDPQQLIDNVAFTVRVIDEVCRQAALEVNFSKGKTECLLILRGRGSQAVRAPLRSCDSAGVFRERIEFAPGRFVRVTPSYKHVGALINTSSSLAAEAEKRVASARAAFAPIVYKVLGNFRFSLAHRRGFAKALVLSRWPVVSVSVLRRLEV